MWQRNILVRKKLLLSTTGDLSASHHDSIKPLDLITLWLILCFKLLYILFCKVGILILCSAEAHCHGSRLLIDLTAHREVIHKICIGNIVQITIFLPLLVSVCHFLIILLVIVYAVRRKDQITVKQWIDHDHDQHDNYDHTQESMK